MNTIIAVVVIGLMVGLVVMMVRYARFIHRYPREMQDKIDRESGTSGKDDRDSEPPDSGKDR